MLILLKKPVTLRGEEVPAGEVIDVSEKSAMSLIADGAAEKWTSLITTNKGVQKQETRRSQALKPLRRVLIYCALRRSRYARRVTRKANLAVKRLFHNDFSR
jgi:hypothetical protein